MMYVLAINILLVLYRLRFSTGGLSKQHVRGTFKLEVIGNKRKDGKH